MEAVHSIRKTFIPNSIHHGYVLSYVLKNTQMLQHIKSYKLTSWGMEYPNKIFKTRLVHVQYTAYTRAYTTWVKG